MSTERQIKSGVLRAGSWRLLVQGLEPRARDLEAIIAALRLDANAMREDEARNASASHEG